MKLKKLFISAALSLFVFSSAFAYFENDNLGDDKKSKTTTTLEKPGTIVDVALSNENFTTLVAAVKAAGLVETLNSEGPFTVFAPINDAFGKLPKGTVESLLEPENKDQLTALLTYHVVAGEFKANDVVKAIKSNNGKYVIKTVNGEDLTASLKDGKVTLEDSKGNYSTVVIADVAASNGFIHAIDTVVMP